MMTTNSETMLIPHREAEHGVETGTPLVTAKIPVIPMKTVVKTKMAKAQTTADPTTVRETTTTAKTSVTIKTASMKVKNQKRKRKIQRTRTPKRRVGVEHANGMAAEVGPPGHHDDDKAPNTNLLHTHPPRSPLLTTTTPICTD